MLLYSLKFTISIERETIAYSEYSQSVQSLFIYLFICIYIFVLNSLFLCFFGSQIGCATPTHRGRVTLAESSFFSFFVYSSFVFFCFLISCVHREGFGNEREGKFPLPKERKERKINK